jgi:hypothetical protein
VAAPLPFARRAPRLVLFGGPGVRGRAYRQHSAHIERTVRTLGLTEIWDIGPGEVAPPTLAGLPIRRLGALPAPEVSALLAGSAAGFLAYPLAFLGKSSVFAAYTAHGMLPICTGRPVATAEASPTAPRAGAHFWDASASSPLPTDPAEIAAAARSWYEEHSLGTQAAEIAAWVRGSADAIR